MPTEHLPEDEKSNWEALCKGFEFIQDLPKEEFKQKAEEMVLKALPEKDVTVLLEQKPSEFLSEEEQTQIAIENSLREFFTRKDPRLERLEANELTTANSELEQLRSTANNVLDQFSKLEGNSHESLELRDRVLRTQFVSDRQLFDDWRSSLGVYGHIQQARDLINSTGQNSRAYKECLDGLKNDLKILEQGLRKKNEDEVPGKGKGKQTE